MPITLLSQYPLGDGDTTSVSLTVSTILYFHLMFVPFSVWLFSLLFVPDIPLSSLEERKSEHVQLFQERLGQLKQQLAGDRRPPGNTSKHRSGFDRTRCLKWTDTQSRLCSFAVHCVVSHRRTGGLFWTLGTPGGCNEVARWPLFQNKCGQPEQLACFREINIQIHCVELSLSMS